MKNQESHQILKPTGLATWDLNPNIPVFRSSKRLDNLHSAIAPQTFSSPQGNLGVNLKASQR